MPAHSLSPAFPLSLDIFPMFFSFRFISRFSPKKSLWELNPHRRIDYHFSTCHRRESPFYHLGFSLLFDVTAPDLPLVETTPLWSSQRSLVNLCDCIVLAVLFCLRSHIQLHPMDIPDSILLTLFGGLLLCNHVIKPFFQGNLDLGACSSTCIPL